MGTAEDAYFSDVTKQQALQVAAEKVGPTMPVTTQEIGHTALTTTSTDAMRSQPPKPGDDKIYL